MNSRPRTPAMSASFEDDDLTRLDHPILSPDDHAPWEDGAGPVTSPLPKAQSSGRRIGRYMIYEEIARGGMAAVHLGRSLDAAAPRTVAIKQLYKQLAWNQSFVAMFLDEGRLAARVRHPNVVAPLDFVVKASEGELYLVMEYIHGETLSHLLSRGFRHGRAPTPAVAVGITVGALRGLHAAHEAATDEGMPLEIVHRDVSPQNIMVGADGVSRVLDFGVAKASVQDITMDEEELRGKPSYLAPEQIRNQAVDRRADVFSAGVMLWEMLARRRLFRHGDPRVVWVKILSGEIPPPSNYCSDVPPALDEAVLRALDRDRERRFPTARAFADAIIEAMEPASPREIGAWVHQVSGDALSLRAERVASIMDGGRKSRPRWHKAISKATTWPTTIPRTPQLRRWGGVTMVALALAGMALWSTSGSALRAAETAVSPLAANVAIAQTEPAAVAPAAAPVPTPAAAAAPRPPGVCKETAVKPAAPQPAAQPAARPIVQPLAVQPTVAAQPIAQPMPAPVTRPIAQPVAQPAVAARPSRHGGRAGARPMRLAMATSQPALRPFPAAVPAPTIVAAPVPPPIEAAPMRAVPVEAAPAQAAPVAQPAAIAPIEAVPVQPQPVEAMPVVAPQVAPQMAPAAQVYVPNAMEIAPAPRATKARASRRALAGKRVALASKNGALASIGAMNAKALQAYERADYETARKLLRAALDTCSSAGFDHHKVKAVTLTNLGVVLVGGFKQPQLGVDQFRKALEIDPLVPLSKRLAKPEIAAAFRQAVTATVPRA
jgi:serine/threonine protein kinase